MSTFLRPGIELSSAAYRYTPTQRSFIWHERLILHAYVASQKITQLYSVVQGNFTGSAAVALVHCFQDTSYNRTGFTLVGTAAEPVGLRQSVKVESLAC